MQKAVIYIMSTKITDKSYIRKSSFVSDPNWCEWSARHLRDSKNYIIQDIDAVIRDSYGNLLILEIKRFKAVRSKAQIVTLKMIDNAFRSVDGRTMDFNYLGINARFKLRYHGVHVLSLEGDDFHVSSKYLNGKLISDEKLIDFLNFKHYQSNDK